MHAGVQSELVEFFMGHTKGIKWVYDDRNEVHPEDLQFSSFAKWASISSTRRMTVRRFLGSLLVW
jgi:hypothetical protein